MSERQSQGRIPWSALIPTEAEAERWAELQRRDRLENPDLPWIPVRPWEAPVRGRRGLGGWARLLLVGGGIAAAVYFFGPQISHDLGSVVHQVGNMAGVPTDGYRKGRPNTGRGVNFDPPFDPFGLRPDRGERGDEYAANPRGRLHLPPAVGNAEGYRDARGEYQRRECRGSIWGACRIEPGEWREPEGRR
jgi:hypothetical protein